MQKATTSAHHHLAMQWLPMRSSSMGQKNHGCNSMGDMNDDCSSVVNPCASVRCAGSSTASSRSSSTGGSSTRPLHLSRRAAALAAPMAAPALLSALPAAWSSALQALAAGTAASLAAPQPAAASKLPAFADNAWEALGGGPADLYFPDSFLGVWQVSSVLVRVETPLGEDLVPDMRLVNRAKGEDLDKALTYQICFIRNREGRVVYDRSFNTASMLVAYYPDMTVQQLQQQYITWQRDDPNVLQLSMPGGLSARTRVTRRSQEQAASDRLETSEYLQQVFETPSASNARIKASQCFTKYKWRSEEEAARDGGPAIVATQVVSDFLTAYDDEMKYMQAMNRPVVMYTYRMQFRRVPV